MAGQRRRPLHSPGRQASCAARPQLRRRGQVPDRRRGPLPLRYGKARRLSLGQSPKRLAASPHPLLALRACLRHAAHNPDVLPRRSPVRAGPDLQLGARPRSPAAHDLDLRPGDDRAGVGARVPLRHRPARPRSDPDGALAMTLPPTPSQTIGPFYHFAMPFPGGECLVHPDDPDAVRIAGTVYDGAGEPVADAMVEIWQANRSGRYAHPEDDRDDLPLEEGFTGFGDRKSTRLNSSHANISYAVFCLKKKKIT